MFDNEIDWVMRIRHESFVPAAARQLAGFSCMDDAIQGRAHCKAAAMRCKQVFNARRVSLGVRLASCVSIGELFSGEVK